MKIKYTYSDKTNNILTDAYKALKAFDDFMADKLNLDVNGPVVCVDGFKQVNEFLDHPERMKLTKIINRIHELSIPIKIEVVDD